jgi:hypothetical protein
MFRSEFTSCRELVTNAVTTVTTLAGIVTTTVIPVCDDRIRLQPVTLAGVTSVKTEKKLLVGLYKGSLITKSYILPRESHRRWVIRG